MQAANRSFVCEESLWENDVIIVLFLPLNNWYTRRFLLDHLKHDNGHVILNDYFDVGLDMHLKSHFSFLFPIISGLLKFKILDLWRSITYKSSILTLIPILRSQFHQ